MTSLLLLVALTSQAHSSLSLRTPFPDTEPVVIQASQHSEGVIRTVTPELETAPWIVRVIAKTPSALRVYGYLYPINGVATLKFKPGINGELQIEKVSDGVFKYKQIRNSETISEDLIADYQYIDVSPANGSQIIFRVRVELR